MDSPPTTQVKGYGAYPVGGSPGGTGNFILEVFEGQYHFSRPKTIYSNALNQYNYVDFTRNIAILRLWGRKQKMNFQFACLGETCDRMFVKWKPCKRHIKICCGIYPTKANIEELTNRSSDKAKKLAVTKTNIEMKDEAKDETNNDIKDEVNLQGIRSCDSMKGEILRIGQEYTEYSFSPPKRLETSSASERPKRERKFSNLSEIDRAKFKVEKHSNI